MNRVALLILSTLVLAACGGTGRPQADQDRDGSMLASALRGAWVHGSTFKMDQRVVLTGGGSNSGQSYDIHSTVDGGTLRDDTARFAYRKDDTAQLSATRQGHQSQTFDMLVADGRVFVRKHGQSEWKAATLPSASSLFPVLRLDLLRRWRQSNEVQTEPANQRHRIRRRGRLDPFFLQACLHKSIDGIADPSLVFHLGNR